MYDRSYFLEPDGKSSKSYVLLAKTLADTERVAIVHFALRNKTRLAALRVKDFSKRDVMVVHTLLWPDEIRDPDFPVLDQKVEIKPAELKMAGQVVDSMADDFHPERFQRHLPGAAQRTGRGQARGRRGVHHRRAAGPARRDRGRLRPAGQARGQCETSPRAVRRLRRQGRSRSVGDIRQRKEGTR